MALSVLITGASSGIGRSIAEHAARQGARIVLVARREDALASVAVKVRELGGEPHVLVCDVAERHKALECVDRAEALMGGIDVAVINAGVGRHRMLVEHDLDDAEALLKTNVFGALYFAHALAPKMLARKSGFLVFMASVAGLLPVPGEAVYSASKFAVVGLAEALSIELEPRDHRLGVAAGMVDPRVREGREVGVLAEDHLGRDVFGQLDEPARVTQKQAQRIERLDVVQLIGAQEALAQRRHAEVQDHARQGLPTGAAGSGRSARFRAARGRFAREHQRGFPHPGAR